MEKVKLYHIDRLGNIKVGQKVDYIKDIVIHRPFLKAECADIMQEYFPNGLSMHGKRFFLEGYNSASCGMDVIFEYERRLHYPEKLSRYEAFFAFDEKGVQQFIEKKELDYEFFKVYEIDYDYYERHNMNFVSGWAHFDTIVKAKYYWENREDYNKDKEPIYEYLVKFPITIGKEVDPEKFIKKEEKQ